MAPGRWSSATSRSGLAHGVGWNAIVVALSVVGHRGARPAHSDGEGRWKPVLVGCLALAPLAAVLVAGVALPVYPRAALDRVRRWRRARRRYRPRRDSRPAAAARRRRRPGSRSRSGRSWRARCARIPRTGGRQWPSSAVSSRRATRSSCYPSARDPRSPTTRPTLRIGRVGRGEAVSVVVAGEPGDATATARAVVSPPRYALLSQDASGRRLVVQRWVRPGA